MRAMLALAAFVIGAACGPGFAEQQGARNWDSERSRMVSDQLRARDITDTRVLNAMLKVPRHLFVPEPQRGQAYVRLIRFPSATTRPSRSPTSWRS